jgi:hypothetical protein
MTVSHQSSGPAMVFTTPYLRRAPRRVALSTQAISLPGTYQLSRVIGAVVGGIVGIIPGLILLDIFSTWYPLLVLMILGGTAGVGATTWKSSTGESFIQWALLFVAKRTGLVKIRGRWVRAYVGACRLERAAFGPVQVVAASVETLTPSEIHGEWVLSAPVRPRTRTAKPHPEDITTEASNDYVQTSSLNLRGRFRDAIAKTAVVIHDIRVQVHRERGKAKKRHLSDKQPIDANRSGMTVVTRHDRSSPGPDSQRSTPPPPPHRVSLAPPRPDRPSRAGR